MGVMNRRDDMSQEKNVRAAMVGPLCECGSPSVMGAVAIGWPSCNAPFFAKCLTKCEKKVGEVIRDFGGKYASDAGYG